MPFYKPLTFLFCFLFTSAFAQTNSISKCEQILSKNTLTTSDFQVLDSIIFGINYYNSDVPRQLYSRARAKAVAQNLPEVYLNFDIWLADMFYETDQRDSCQHYASHVAKESKELGLDLIYAKSANIRRLLFTGKNDFTEAYETCYEALAIFERENDFSGMGVANRDIGSIKLLEKKYREALVFCKKSAEYLLQAENWYELTFTFQRIGIIYRNQGKFDLAHDYILKSIDASRKLYGFRVDQGIAKKFWTQGYVYEAEGKYDLALASFDSTRYYGERVNYDKVERSVHNTIGEIRLKTGEYQMALENFKTALSTTEKLKLKQYGYDYYVPIFENMAKAYEGIGDYKSANFLLNKIAIDKDSLFTISSEKQVAELQTKYETVQKEAQISQLESEKLWSDPL